VGRLLRAAFLKYSVHSSLTTFSLIKIIQISHKIMSAYLWIFSKLVSYYTWVNVANSTVGSRELTKPGLSKLSTLPLLTSKKRMTADFTMLPGHLVRYSTVSLWRLVFICPSAHPPPSNYLAHSKHSGSTEWQNQDAMWIITRCYPLNTNTLINTSHN